MGGHENPQTLSNNNNSCTKKLRKSSESSNFVELQSFWYEIAKGVLGIRKLDGIIKICKRIGLGSRDSPQMSREDLGNHVNPQTS